MPYIPEPVIDGWYDLLDDGGIVIGIDPGAHTGIVCFYVPPDLSITGAKWLGSATVTPTSSEKLNAAQRDLDFIGRIAVQVTDFRVNSEIDGLFEETAKIPEGASDCVHVALEEPLDATVKWRGGAHKQSTGTAFRLGAYYMAALGAVTEAHRIADIAQVSSYPVTNHGNRIGWMQGAGRRIGKREHVYMLIEQQIRVMGAPEKGIPDHEMSAAGVGLFHLSQIQQARMTRKVENVKKAAEWQRKAEEKAARKAAAKAKKDVEKAARKAGAL